MKKFYLLLPLLVMLFSGCKKTDLTPSWLVINDFTLTTNEVTEGENTHNITDAWVYMDNVALGVFELPARIPVLAEGTHNFVIYPGIKVNGISATRQRYPFYNRFETSIELTRGMEHTVTPATTYKSNLQFELIENFENVGFDFDKDLISDTDIVVLTSAMYPDTVAYGNNCGAVYLNLADSLYKGQTNTNLNLPGGEDVYVEIDYMNTNSIAMGVIAENSGGTAEHPPLVILNAQDESELQWKKIYINLIDDVSYEINATSFEIYLLGILDGEETSGVIYLDNIKVVRFE